jgi:hypothetical protein
VFPAFPHKRFAEGVVELNAEGRERSEHPAPASY